VSLHFSRPLERTVVLLVVVCACTTDPDPLPGYVPDPDEYTVPAEVAKVRDVPDAPGLQAPVDHLLLVLAPDAGREVAEAIATSEGGTIVGQIPALRFYQLKLPTETMDALFAVIDRARLVPGVEAAGLDPVVQFSGCPAESDIDRLPTADLRCPWESVDYSPTLTAFEEMRDELELHEVTVGIVDSPLDRASGEFDDVRLASVDHPGGRFPEELEDPGVDDEGHNHGTAVAQIIAGDDDTGINGIASRFLGRRLRVAFSGLPMGASVRATAHNVITGVQRLLTAGAHVINVSLELSESDAIPAPTLDLLRRVFEHLVRQDRRVLFVVAAGNSGVDLDGMNRVPGGLQEPNVLTVGSHAACNPEVAAADSNRGLVDLAAQGDGVYVYDSSLGREALLNGTSFAAPQVAALAAVLRSVAPELTGAELRREILEGAAPGPAVLGGRSLNLGRPLLNVVRTRSAVFAEVIDRDDDAESDPIASVAARLCDGSGYVVENVAAYGYYSETDDATQLGQIASGELEGQFGMTLQHPDADGLAFVVDAPFALTSFPLGDEGVGAVSYVDTSRALGGRVVAGTWTIDACAILDRWDRLIATHDAPKTVLVRSTLDATLEVDLPDGDEPLLTPIRGTFAIPFQSFAGGSTGDVRLVFDANDPVLRTLEAMCEGGRG
jgi:subtilisin family serine protease